MKTKTTTKVIVTNKTGKFTLLKRPEIAPNGFQNGVISDVFNVTGTKAGKAFSNMEIQVALDATDSNGDKFILTKVYNIGEGGRGIGLFLNDYDVMAGKTMNRTDLYDFDPESLKGTRVTADVDYGREGNDVVSVIKGFADPKAVE